MSARTPALRSLVIRARTSAWASSPSGTPKTWHAAAAGRTAPARSASTASTIRLRPTAKAIPGSGGPPRSSDRRAGPPRAGACGSCGEHYRAKPAREAAPGQRRTADLLRQPVVAAAAAYARLGAEQGVVELVGGPRVVVEAADQAGRVGEGDAEADQEAAHGVVVRLALGAEVVGHHRRVLGLSADLGALVVEDPERVDLDPQPGVGVEVEPAQEPLQRLAVDRAADLVAKAVQQQRELLQAKRLVGVPGDRDRLGVDRRVLGPDRLQVELVELPVAAGHGGVG